jgi:hypothetical protein
MDLGSMRIDADLNIFDAEVAKPPGFRLTNHGSVRLHFYVEQQAARVCHKFKEVTPKEDFASAEGEEKDTSVRELIKNRFDLRGRHLAMIVMIEIAVNAAFIAAIGDVKVRGERYSSFERALRHLLHESHRAGS